MGKKFELMIDCYGLNHIFGQPTLNARKTRWLEFLNEYDFEIKHIKGEENQLVDALNIRAHEVHISSISMFNRFKRQNFRGWKLDQQYLKIKGTLQQDNLQKKINYYEFKEDVILMYKGEIYVPNYREMKKYSVDGNA